MDDPFEFVKDGCEGIGNGDVVVNEEPVLIAAAFGDSPTHNLRWASENLGFTGCILTVSFLAGNAITEAASINDGKEAIAEFTFHRLREFYGNDTRGEGFVEHGPQTFADASGVDDDVLRIPGFGKGLYFAEDGDVILTRPLLEVYGTVGRGLEGLQGGEIYLDNAQSYGIARPERIKIECTC